MLEQVFVKNVISTQNAVAREELYSCREIQVIMSETPNIVIQEKGFIVVDFGQELCGRLHILSVKIIEALRDIKNINLWA